MLFSFLACPPGSYKMSSRQQECFPCPANSVAEEDGSVVCVCEEDHFRTPLDTPSAPCTSNKIIFVSLYFSQSFNNNVCFFEWKAIYTIITMISFFPKVFHVIQKIHLGFFFFNTALVNTLPWLVIDSFLRSVLQKQATSNHISLLEKVNLNKVRWLATTRGKNLLCSILPSGKTQRQFFYVIFNSF